MTARSTTLVRDRLFVESARWHGGRVWFCDQLELAVLSVNEDGSDLRTEARVPGRPSGLAWLPDGRLLVVSMTDQLLLRLEVNGQLAVHADLASLARGPCNELVVDSQGRAYVGDLGFDPSTEPSSPGSLFRIDGDGTVASVARGLWFPNGCAVTSADVLIVSETFGNRITAFDITATGDLVNRREWARFGPAPGGGSLESLLSRVDRAPDGMSLASTGSAVWIADIVNRQVVCVEEGGRVVAEISLDLMPFAVALGGHDGHTLFVCAAPGFDETERRRRRDAQVMSIELPGS